jgi:hypothetical protein
LAQVVQAQAALATMAQTAYLAQSHQLVVGVVERLTA